MTASPFSLLWWWCWIGCERLGDLASVVCPPFHFAWEVECGGLLRISIAFQKHRAEQGVFVEGNLLTRLAEANVLVTIRDGDVEASAFPR